MVVRISFEECPKAPDGWGSEPEHPSNGLVWTATDHPFEVYIHRVGRTARVLVSDGRATGSCSRVEIARFEATDDVQYSELPECVTLPAIERAIEWMRATDLDAWEHSSVCEAVFEPPAGYELDQYYVENREAIVYYRRVDASPTQRLAGRGRPEEYTPETCPYLYVHEWRGSGNATVALAPWRGAHGPGSKHPEIEPILDLPDGCGLENAVAAARDWASSRFQSSDLSTADARS